jgi:hypothetical protein
MCSCVKKLNKLLKAHNTVLGEVSMLSMKTGKCRQSLQIVSQRIQRGGPKPKVVLPTFCPFCGKRSAPKPAAVTSQERQP